MNKLQTRLTQLEKQTQGGLAMKFLCVTTWDGINYYATPRDGHHIDITTLDPANLPQGVTHYTEAELNTQPEGVKVLCISYASAAERKADILKAMEIKQNEN